MIYIFLIIFAIILWYIAPGIWYNLKGKKKINLIYFKIKSLIYLDQTNSLIALPQINPYYFMTEYASGINYSSDAEANTDDLPVCYTFKIPLNNDLFTLKDLKFFIKDCSARLELYKKINNTFSFEGFDMTYTVYLDYILLSVHADFCRDYERIARVINMPINEKLQYVVYKRV